MNELNVELVRKLQQSRRSRPPSETMRRLQMELPFLAKKAGTDNEPSEHSKQKKKRGRAETGSDCEPV